MTYSRETFLSFHRQSAERDARLYADLERAFASLDAAREHFEAMQKHTLDEIARVVTRRFTEDEIGDALKAMRQQRRDGEW